MPCKRQLLILAITVTLLLLQSCATTSPSPDPQRQELALERWNGCLLRAGIHADRLCEGHKRDVLSTYPAHLERQLRAKMNQRYEFQASSQLVKTRYEIRVNPQNYSDIENAVERSREANIGNL